MKRRILRLLKSTAKLVVFFALCVAGYYAYTMYVNPPEEEQGFGELPTAVAEVRDITVSVSATGVLQPIRIVEVKSKASGEILEMPVEMGDLLQRGDLIAQVDTRILDQEYKQAEADLQSAQTRRDIAERQYLRAQELHGQDLISENDLESSEQNFTNAEGQLLRAEATLQLAQERLEDATVTAPITGTIINKTVEEGVVIQSSMSNVSGGTTLVQMADLTALQIRTLVDEIDIGKVGGGLEVKSTVEAFPDRNFSGQVMKIEPQAVTQQSVTTFPVLSFIDNSEGMLLPGMNADVNIIVHERPGVLAVPNEAVRTPDDAREVVALLELDASGLGEMYAGGGAGGASMGGAMAHGGEMRPGGDARPAGADALAEEARAGGESESGREAGSGEGGMPSGERGQGGERQPMAGGSGAPGQATGERPQAAGPGGREGGGQGQRGQGRGEGGRFGGMDMSDPAVRRMMEEMRSRRQAERDAAARDPWGVEGARREPAVVFVMDADGVITPRQILSGVRDWEFTEVIEGLEAGVEVVLLPSTSLLRAQEDLRNRFSGRSMIPGMGGRGGGPGRGGPPH